MSDDAMDVDSPAITPPRTITLVAPRPVIAPPRPVSSAGSLNYKPKDVENPVYRSSSVPLRAPKYTVGYTYSPEMTAHFHPNGHPECPERITGIWQAIVAAGYHKRMKCLPIRPVYRDEALLVHSEDLWNAVLALQHMTGQEIADSEKFYEEESLYVTAGTTRAARLSCGGVIEACLSVARGELKKTFAIVRPPGHHAEPEQSMGFCFFNNVAVAVKVVQRLTPTKKVLILDWDVHHGNGVQRAFEDDPSVLYISIHRYEDGDFYPCGTYGGMGSCGSGAGRGFSVNIPWPESGMQDADYIHAFQRIVMPIAVEFAPELVIISAGFDAANGDDLGECHVSPAGYAHMAHMLSGLAGGRMVVALEGGYNIESIKASALAVTSVLLGEPPAPLMTLAASPNAAETVWLVAREQSKYWKNLDPKACEPATESISISVSEILKAHRQHDMYVRHKMLQIPLPATHEARFSSQIMCSQDMLDKDVLVLFVHEFGNLRAEISNSATCDITAEKGYLIDVSQKLINWIKTEGYGLVDVNMYPKPQVPSVASTSEQNKKLQTPTRSSIVKYVWDNYVQLSSARKIVLIGHGAGCRLIFDLIEKRGVGVMRSVKAVIQVVGNASYSGPGSPENSTDLKMWYLEHSYVLLPSTHSILGPNTKASFYRRHGQISEISEPQFIKLLTRALPAIQGFVRTKLYPSTTAGPSRLTK